MKGISRGRKGREGDGREEKERERDGGILAPTFKNVPAPLILFV